MRGGFYYAYSYPFKYDFTFAFCRFAYAYTHAVYRITAVKAPVRCRTVPSNLSKKKYGTGIANVHLF